MCVKCTLIHVFLLILCLNSVSVVITFSRVVDDAKHILVTCICVCVCLCVSLSVSTCPHYCPDPDVTWRNGRGLVVHYWVDLQSVHGFRCCDNIVPIAKCQRVLVLSVCLVSIIFIVYLVIVIYSVMCTSLWCLWSVDSWKKMYSIKSQWLDLSV